MSYPTSFPTTPTACSLVLSINSTVTIGYADMVTGWTKSSITVCKSQPAGFVGIVTGY